MQRMESERKIEKLLRAYAKKRRAEAGEPLSLHSATRRLLQGEIARQKPSPDDDEEHSMSLWQLFRQQWALLLGFTLIIFLGATLFLPALSKAKSKAQRAVAMSKLKEIGAGVDIAAKENNGILPATLDELTNGIVSTNTLVDPLNGKPFVYVAGGRVADDLKSNEVLAYSGADKNGHIVLLADGEVKVAKAGEFQRLTNGIGNMELAKAERRLEPPATAAVSGPMREHATETDETILANASPAISPEAPAIATRPTLAGSALNKPLENQAAGGAPVFAASKQLIQKDQSLAQNMFRNQSVQNKFPVLTAFALQQNGNSLQIVDRDGSVYRGTISNASKGSSNELLSQNYRFNVSGTNLTLKQNVVFNGSIETVSPPLPSDNNRARSPPVKFPETCNRKRRRSRHSNSLRGQPPKSRARPSWTTPTRSKSKRCHWRRNRGFNQLAARCTSKYPFYGRASRTRFSIHRPLLMASLV